jgi:hypothetical protein
MSEAGFSETPGQEFWRLNPDFTFQMREQVSLKRQDKNSGG